MAQSNTPVFNNPPIDFDLRDLPPTPAAPIVPPRRSEVAEQDPNRLQSLSLPCENQRDINNLLNDRFGPEGRQQLDRALSSCRPGERLNMDFYNDGSVQIDTKGFSALRIRGRF